MTSKSISSPSRLQRHLGPNHLNDLLWKQNRKTRLSEGRTGLSFCGDCLAFTARRLFLLNSHSLALWPTLPQTKHPRSFGGGPKGISFLGSNIYSWNANQMNCWSDTIIMDRDGKYLQRIEIRWQLLYRNLKESPSHNKHATNVRSH